MFRKIRTKISRNDLLVEISLSLFILDFLLLSRYSCGPTVYDSSHIGHASTYVTFDIIHRILKRVFNYNIVLMMGITDIDDKIINRSQKVVFDLNLNEQNRNYSIEYRRKYIIWKYRRSMNKNLLMICRN